MHKKNIIKYESINPNEKLQNGYSNYREVEMYCLLGVWLILVCGVLLFPGFILFLALCVHVCVV